MNPIQTDSRERIQELEKERLSTAFVDSPLVAYPIGTSRGIYLVWEDDRVATSLVVFNYWKLRNGPNPRLRITVFSETGEILAVEDATFGEKTLAREIPLRRMLEQRGIPLPFRGSVWLEASSSGIDFAHIGCVVQYRTSSALTQVHTSHWSGDDKRPYIQDQHVPVWCGGSERSFVYFPNGHQEAAGEMSCTLINARGERRAEIVSVGLKPFATFFRFIDDLFPAAAEFLGGAPGWLQVDVRCAGVNRRAFVGMYDESARRIAAEHTTGYVYLPTQAPKYPVYWASPWPDAASADLDVYVHIPVSLDGTLRYFGAQGILGSVRFSSPQLPEYRCIPVGQLCPVEHSRRTEITHVEMIFDGLGCIPNLVSVWSRDGKPVCFSNLGTTAMKAAPTAVDHLRRQAKALLRGVLVRLGLKAPLPKQKIKRLPSKWAPLLGGAGFDHSFLAIHSQGQEDLVLKLKIYYESGDESKEGTYRIPAGTSRAISVDELCPNEAVRGKTGYLYAEVLAGAGPMDEYYYYGVEKNTRNFYCDHAF